MKKTCFYLILLVLISAVHPLQIFAGPPPATDHTKVKGPIFVVDPYWPKPLPNRWITGSIVGLSIDAQDNVWTIQRLNTVEANFKAADLHLGECCKVAPPVLEYDQAGNLLKSWGGPGEGYRWPDSEH